MTAPRPGAFCAKRSQALVLLMQAHEAKENTKSFFNQAGDEAQRQVCVFPLSSVLEFCHVLAYLVLVLEGPEVMDCFWW